MNYIKGTYSREIFVNDSNGYTVGLIKVIDSSYENIESTCFFVGTFSPLKLKSNYIMNGEFVNNSKYGKQFLVSSYELVIPTKKDEIIEFLASDLFPIGESTASKIVNKFGDNTLDIILKDKNQLLLVPRISQKRIDKIYSVLLEYQQTSKIVMELTKLGFNSKNALTILKKYNSKSLDLLDKNIYDFITTFQFSFNDIDNIALNMGMESHDDRRLKALVIHVMNDITFNMGDIYSYFDEIYSEMTKYVEDLTKEELEYILIKLNKDNLVIIEKNKYYLKTLFDSEDYIINKLTKLNDYNRDNFKNLDKKIEELEKINDIKYDNTQINAIKKAINNNFTIITGGPGTGKTTIIKAIVALFKSVIGAKEEEMALLAPTGRASKRICESTLTYASTIHKYLKWDKEQNKFCVDEFCKNKEKYIIVDEVSMIDSVLLSSLLKGIRDDIKLILVGDYHQLPSVSQGQVLKDLIETDVFDVIKLNNLYRQNSESYIIELAQEIKNKELSESFLLKKEDYNFIECSNEQVIGMIESVIKKALERGYTDKDIQVLAPMYKTINGIDNLNIMLQKLFNPYSKDKNELSFGDTIYREGDKVLQLVNDNDNNVYNGDIGYIVEINNKKEITIDYEGIFVKYTRENFINFRHGYAISIHKSQGGEFKMIIIPIVNSFMRMLYNKLLYTAVTRAKEKLILVGDIHAFATGIRNDYIESRKTSLKEKIISKYNN